MATRASMGLRPSSLLESRPDARPRERERLACSRQGRSSSRSGPRATIDGQTDVFSPVSQDGGRTFAAPVRVNSSEFDARWRAAAAGRPEAAARTVPAIVVVWTATPAAGATAAVARSDDGGRYVHAAAPVPGSDAVGQPRLGVLAAGGPAASSPLWLDHRGHAPPHAARRPRLDVHGGGRGDRRRGERATVDLFRSSSAARCPRRSGWRLLLLQDGDRGRPNGSIYAAWRHVFTGGIRTSRSRSRAMAAARSHRP